VQLKFSCLNTANRAYEHRHQGTSCEKIAINGSGIRNTDRVLISTKTQLAL